MATCGVSVKSVRWRCLTTQHAMQDPIRAPPFNTAEKSVQIRNGIVLHHIPYQKRRFEESVGVVSN